jgi:rhodanese-related sulfurtransferase
MPTTIDRETVQQLMAENAQLVDVRSREDYDGEHIRGAISLPIESLDRESASRLDARRPAITYCWDSQ